MRKVSDRFYLASLPHVLLPKNVSFVFDMLHSKSAVSVSDLFEWSINLDGGSEKLLLFNAGLMLCENGKMPY